MQLDKTLINIESKAKSPPLPGLIIKLNLIGLALICVPSLSKRGVETEKPIFFSNI